MTRPVLEFRATGRQTGKGVFTKSRIAKGELVFKWDGTKRIGPVPWYVGHRWLQVGQLEWLAPRRGSPGWYINHACEPNAGIHGSIEIVAMRDIEAGEEITLDYSLCVSEPEWRLECRCGSSACRRLIQSYELLPQKLKDQYRRYTSEYLLARSVAFRRRPRAAARIASRSV
ncbi:MAG: SET domain-containing protein [Kofleriaceae bacterium]